jgi:hypothetical protein
VVARRREATARQPPTSRLAPTGMSAWWLCCGSARNEYYVGRARLMEGMGWISMLTQWVWSEKLILQRLALTRKR